MQQLPAKPFLLSRPTPVRHAAAITIQRWFRQHHNRPHNACSHAAEQTSLFMDHNAKRQQQAARCIQTCWRKHQVKAQSLLDQLSSAEPSTSLTGSDQKSSLYDDQRKGVKVILQHQYCIALPLQLFVHHACMSTVQAQCQCVDQAQSSTSAIMTKTPDNNPVSSR